MLLITYSDKELLAEILTKVTTEKQVVTINQPLSARFIENFITVDTDFIIFNNVESFNFGLWNLLSSKWIWIKKNEKVIRIKTPRIVVTSTLLSAADFESINCKHIELKQNLFILKSSTNE